MGAAPVAGHGTRSQGDGDSKTGYPPTANAQGRGGGRPRPRPRPRRRHFLPTGKQICGTGGAVHRVSFSSSRPISRADALSAGSSALPGPRGSYRPSRGEPRLIWRRSAAGAGPTPISGKTALRLVLAPTFQPRSSSPSSLLSLRRVRSLPACPPALEGGVGPSRLPRPRVSQTPVLSGVLLCSLASSWAPALLLPRRSFRSHLLREAPETRGGGARPPPSRDTPWFQISSHWQRMSGCVVVPRAPLEGVLVL